MSRPGSRKGKKGSAKSPKKQIAELTEQNQQLSEQITTLRAQNEQLEAKMIAVTNKLVNSINKKDFCISDQTDLTQLTPDVLLEMVERLVVRKKLQEMSVEARVEELETRVTHMSMDIAKQTKKTLAYESGLEYLSQCSNLDDIRDKVYELQLLAGQEFHAFSYHDPERPKEILINGVDRPDSATRRMLENAEKLNLVPPKQKLPGEVSVKNMHRDLKLYVTKELSEEKASGADWRLFAERVGIDQDTINHWRSLHLAYPMGRVFQEWGNSDSATVRMLHRHLMSPQLRRTILAKRVSDFYHVD